MKFVKEFKEFISKGNVVDMAVGVVVGGAFGKIVTSLVSDLIMPLVGLLTGGGSLKDMFVVLGDKTGFDPATMTTPALATEAGFATFNYGNFIQTILDFVLIALSIFVVIKVMAVMKTKLSKEKEEEEPAPATTKKCPFCCSEIDIAAVKCPNCTSDIPEEAAE
ncbi:MAG: large conductance mechanosensitive channel protein MscL [Clostridia bacterium]|nr:large conductance mechanosensitive channel protein MscL [Clostridia bacterium]